MRVRRCSSLSCGASHTFLVSEDGAFGWGCNEERQLGLVSERAYEPLPVCVLRRRVRFAEVRTLKLALVLPRMQIKMISCGTHHAAAVTTEGTVWAWGLNKHGELGRSLPEMSGLPLEVEGLPPVASVACGQAHTIALTMDASIVTWGSNQYGELGRSDGSYLPRSVAFPDSWQDHL